MDKIARRLLALALPLTCAVPAAATDQDTFNKLITKYAVDETTQFTSFKPKSACACTDSSVPTPTSGFLFFFGGNQLGCGLPTFDSNGKLSRITGCFVFEVLGK